MITMADDLQVELEQATTRAEAAEAEVRELERQVSFLNREAAVRAKILAGATTRMVRVQETLDRLESGLQVVAECVTSKLDYRLGEEGQKCVTRFRALLRSSGLWRGEKPR